MTGSTGSYSINWTPPYPGSYLLQASWNGNNQLAGSTSSSTSLTVTGATPASTSLRLSLPSTGTQGEVVHMTITAFNPTNSLLNGNVTMQITGPNNYAAFDVIQTSVNPTSQLTTHYDWIAPNQSGTYVVTIELLPATTGAYDTATIQIS